MPKDNPKYTEYVLMCKELNVVHHSQDDPMWTTHKGQMCESKLSLNINLMRNKVLLKITLIILMTDGKLIKLKL